MIWVYLFPSHNGIERLQVVQKCVRYKIIQIMTLHRAYITPCSLNKYDNTLSKSCWHGCEVEGTLMHLLWYCPPVKRFWLNVVKSLSRVLNIDIKPCKITCILGANMDTAKPKIVHYAVLLPWLIYQLNGSF